MGRVFNAEKTISKDKALDAILTLQSGIGRATFEPQIKNIEVLTSASFYNLKRSEIKNLPDTVAYIVNYLDNKGYTIISASHRIKEDIISHSEFGNLSIDDARDNTEVGMIFDYVEDYLYSTLMEADLIQDSLQLIMNNSIPNGMLSRRFENNIPMQEVPIRETEVYYTDVTPFYDTYRLKPFSHVEWAQYAPFSDKVNEVLSSYPLIPKCPDGKPYPVGCVPVMVAQVMSYYSFPASLNGLSLDWNTLNRYTGAHSYKNKEYIGYAPKSVQSTVANLMDMLGGMVNITYGCKGSSADYEKDGLKALRSMGFKVDSPREYDFQYIKSSLDNKRIVTANGKSEKKNWIFFNTYGGGHAWVIDGYLEQEKQVRVDFVDYDWYQNAGRKEYVGTRTFYTTESRSLVGMNWGWGGYSNGYFALSSFDSNTPIVSSRSTEGDFKYKKRVAAVYR